MPSSPNDKATLRIKVVPNTAKTEFAGWLEDGALKVRVHSSARDGEVDMPLIAFLAKNTGVSKNQISIPSGETALQKLIAFDRLSSSQFEKIPRPVG